MNANFLYIISNITQNSNEKGEIVFNSHDIQESSTDKIENIVIPENASMVILFKNEISGRESDGTPKIEKFKPTEIKKYIITTQPLLNLPSLLARADFPRHAADGISGAYVLRDGTLYLTDDETKRSLIPILESSIKNGKVQPELNDPKTFN